MVIYVMNVPCAPECTRLAGVETYGISLVFGCFG